MEEIIKKNYKAEMFDYTLYSELAKLEKNPKVKDVLLELAEGEKSHAEFWKSIADSRNIKLENLNFFDRLKLFILKTFRKLLGLPLTIKLAEMGEINDAEKYYELSKNETFSDTEKQKLQDIMNQELVHEEILTQSQINAERISEAIYAVSDGLIEVLAGVSGLDSVLNTPFLVALGGLIIGISGMISMSIGAYLSSSSEEDIKKNKLKDMNKTTEGIKSESGESVKITAISYILGAIIPIIPFLIGISGILGLISSYVITGISTLIVGSIIGLLSNVNPIKKGVIMTGLALSAALVTHGIGYIFHMVGY
ncbi:ferritin, CCC1 [Acidianus sulfidivorans JP7]|uniref:Ferritin, CCC1 n=1 Tax=Acidianus sulfidivorans JP7 TaxID=619593 RepID=A0A2U9IKK4_9CREN|nr:VIT1/CCC1 family protein [Acidianus sulfidivorans]AWR96454.1 ferritin, CCC1 [Acidianus sulfidivorans JP7]